MTATDRQFLYGMPGAQHMEFTPEAVLRYSAEDPVTVEQWTVHPPRHHLPTAGHLLEWLAESDYDVDEGWWEDASGAATSPEVIAAAEALLDLMASKLVYRMANRHVATMHYRWDGDDKGRGKYLLISREERP